VLAAACGGDDDDGTDESGQEDDIEPNGVLRTTGVLSGATAVRFDPTKMPPGGYIAALPVIRPLMTRNADGTLKPDLAKSARVIDSSTVEVVLRENMKFSDGTPLDAAAVKATFERNLASNNSNGLQIIDMQNVASITVDSPTQLTIKTKTPVAAIVYTLLAGVEFAPTSPAWMANPGDGLKAVGAGPMMIKEYVPDTKVTMVKNPNYWDADNIKLAGIEYINAADGQAMINALQAGQVDYIFGSVLTNIDQLRGLSAPFVFNSKPTQFPFSMWLCIDNRTPIGNMKVRQAIAYAIDREEYNEVIYGGESEPAWGLWPSDSIWHDEDLDDVFERDIDKAKQLLREAGYPNGVSFNILVGATGDSRPQELLQGQLADAGIQMNIIRSANSSAEFFQLAKEPALMSQSRPGPLDKISRHFLSTSFTNVCKYKVPKHDQLYAELAGLPIDSDEAIEIWGELQESIVRDEAMAIFTAFQVINEAYNSDRVGEVATYIDQLGQPNFDPVGTYMKK
jgi:peptide/nickel transport system substrate-binding protein